MINLELARLIHEDREREIARAQLARAVREARRYPTDAPFVPAGGPSRITHPLRVARSGGGIR